MFVVYLQTGAATKSGTISAIPKTRATSPMKETTPGVAILFSNLDTFGLVSVSVCTTIRAHLNALQTNGFDEYGQFKIGDADCRCKLKVWIF